MTAADTTPLETGWGPGTPVEDTVLHRFTHTHAASWVAAGEAHGARVRRDDRFAAVDRGRPAALGNSATLLRPLHGEAFDDALDALERFYDEAGSGEALLWSPWPTPDLRQRGWRLEGHPPLLLRPPGPPVDVPTPEGLEVVEVTGRAEIEEFCAVTVGGFPFDDLRPYGPGSLLDDRLLDDGRFRLLVGRVDGRAVCAGAQFVEHGCNTLLLAATLPEARGNGYYTALAAHRLADRPDLPAVTVVSDHSRPALTGRLGFWPLTRFTLWVRPRA